MKNVSEANKVFQIIFNNRVIQIDYDQTFPEFKNETIKSLIELVLEKLSQPESKKEINKYTLFCPCGSELELNKHLSENLCEHKFLENDNKKNLGEKYLLIEKQDETILNKIQQNEQPLSKKEFEEIFQEKKQIKTKKVQKKKKNDNNKNIKPFIITEAFKKKIKKDITKDERAKAILSCGFPLFYNENNLKTLLSMGIDAKKAKAALRISKDQLEEAILYATDKDLNWEGKEFLFFDNNDLIDENNLNENLKKEVQKEYPFLNEEQVKQRIIDIFEVLEKEKKMKENNMRRIIIAGNELEEEDEDEDDDEEKINL